MGTSMDGERKQSETYDTITGHILRYGCYREMAWRTRMILYTTKEPRIIVSYVDHVLRVNVGLLPLGWVIQLVVWAGISLMFMLLCFYLWVRLLVACIFDGQACDAGLLAYFVVELFFLAGTILMFWCVKEMVECIFPYSAEVFIDTRTMHCGNRLWRRKCRFTGEERLLVEPLYSRGGWGFALRIASNGKKYKLLPSAYVGSSYYKTRARARKLAAQIQECLPFIKIEESKYWKYH